MDAQGSPVILILEDNPEMKELMEPWFKQRLGVVNIHVVETPAAAIAFFTENASEIDIVLVDDGCTHGLSALQPIPKSIDFVRLVASTEKFLGASITMSDSEDYNRQLKEAGCHFMAQMKLKAMELTVNVLRRAQ
jgi:hypothetical protein